jgi:hypothetical protein
MTRRNGRRVAWASAALLACLTAVAWICLSPCGVPKESAAVQRPPKIRPDYAEIVVPPNIAPLDFVVEEPGVEYRVRIHGEDGEDIVVGSRDAGIVIPPRPWRRLLQRNRGKRILFDVYARDGDGRWSCFRPFAQDVAQEEIDSHLVYRLIGPVCTLYCDMGIHQRDLESYRQSPILTYDAAGGCMNCHTFQNNRPDFFSIQVRPVRPDVKGIEAGMIMIRGNRALRLKTESRAAPRAPAYTSWHPQRPIAAFTMIRPKQCFHGAGADVRDVFDADADLALFNADGSVAASSPGVADPAKLETFPAWSADGRTLFFTSADVAWERDQPNIGAVKLKYDLMRVPYDVEHDRWGKPEMMLSSVDTGMSISQARASPDGRYLLFCMADYGTFPVHRTNSDLYLMDLRTRQHRRLTCNSPESESWHCWSSNSRWIVFSSRRDNGLVGRPYFCYIDAKGQEHKPFLLPQEDPRFYDSLLQAYNVPELVTGPVTVSQQELVRAIRSGSPSADHPQKPIPIDADGYPVN